MSVPDVFQVWAARAREVVPEVLAALGLVIGGALLARVLRSWTARLVDRLPWVGRGRSLEAGLRRMGVERSIGEILGTIVFWVVFVVFLTAATETVGLPVVATWLRGISEYLPRVLLAVLIVLAGLLGGAFARETISAAFSAAGLDYGGMVGRVAQTVIVLVAVVTAVDQLGIDSSFFTATIAVLVGSAIGGTALAFGLGARTAVSNIIACHYVRQRYRVGHAVRVAGVEGRIVEITGNAVVLESPEGRVHVPAKEFSETTSILLTGGGP